MAYPIIQSVGIVVFNKENTDEVLLVKHGKTAHHLDGVYGLPSGKIDNDEKAVEASVRELNEETGLVTQKSDLISLPKPYRATIEQKDGIKIFDWFVFLCKDYSGNLISSDETIPEWVKIEDLNSYKLLPNVKVAVLVAKEMML